MKTIEKIGFMLAIVPYAILIGIFVVPAMWLWSCFTDFCDWIRQEWMLLDKTDEEIKTLHNILMGAQGCPCATICKPQPKEEANAEKHN